VWIGTLSSSCRSSCVLQYFYSCKYSCTADAAVDSIDCAARTQGALAQPWRSHAWPAAMQPLLADALAMQLGCLALRRLAT
jgi:hypothetical protein